MKRAVAEAKCQILTDLYVGLLTKKVGKGIYTLASIRQSSMEDLGIVKHVKAKMLADGGTVRRGQLFYEKLLTEENLRK